MYISMFHYFSFAENFKKISSDLMLQVCFCVRMCECKPYV